jgi:hypothetical protein
MRKGARVEEGAEEEDGGGVSIRVEVPRLVPALPEIRVGARSGLGDGDG